MGVDLGIHLNSVLRSTTDSRRCSTVFIDHLRWFIKKHNNWQNRYGAATDLEGTAREKSDATAYITLGAWAHNPTILRVFTSPCICQLAQHADIRFWSTHPLPSPNPWPATAWVYWDILLLGGYANPNDCDETQHSPLPFICFRWANISFALPSCMHVNSDNRNELAVTAYLVHNFHVVRANWLVGGNGHSQCHKRYSQSTLTQSIQT